MTFDSAVAVLTAEIWGVELASVFLVDSKGAQLECLVILDWMIGVGIKGGIGINEGTDGVERISYVITWGEMGVVIIGREWD